MRAYAKRLTNENSKAATISEALNEKYGARAPCTRTIHNWVASFRAAQSLPPARRKYNKLKRGTGGFHYGQRSLHFREFIKVRVEQQKSVTQIFKELQRTYGKDVLSLKSVYKWAYRFQEGYDDDDLSNKHKFPFGPSKTEEEYRNFIRAGLEADKTPSIIFREMQRKYGEASPCLKTVYRWSHRIKTEMDEEKDGIERSQNSQDHMMDESMMMNMDTSQDDDEDENENDNEEREATEEDGGGDEENGGEKNTSNSSSSNMENFSLSMPADSSVSQQADSLPTTSAQAAQAQTEAIPNEFSLMKTPTRPSQSAQQPQQQQQQQENRESNSQYTTPIESPAKPASPSRHG